MSITLHTFADCQEQFDNFLDHYQPVRVVLCGPTPPESQLLKPYRQRRCRFCGRDSREVKFNKTHLLSQLLGNHYTVYDSECAECNARFSRHENDLANFLGIGRTVQSVEGKEKVPTFKSADSLVTARAGEWLGVPGVRIDRVATAADSFRINNEEGRTEINVVKQPYVPLNVYRALLRMALAVMPSVEVYNYLPAIEFLLGHGDEVDFATFCQVVQFTLPSRWTRPYPVCFLFECNEPAARLVKHHFYLAYQNLVFTFPLPLHLADVERGLYSEELTSFCCPPLLPQAAEKDERAEAHRRHLHGRTPIREPETMIISHAPGGFGRNVALDLVTGEPSPAEFNGEEIIGLLIAPAQPGRQLQFPQALPTPSV